jgi:Fic family protein
MDKLRDKYRESFILASNALTNNELTESETLSVLKNGININSGTQNDITINGKAIKNHLEILGMNDCYNYIFKLIHKHYYKKKHVMKLHKLLYSRIFKRQAGEYRKDVLISEHTSITFTKPSDIQNEMDKFFNRIDFYRQNCHPIEYAAKILREFVFISPFTDGNGRMAHLLANLSLLQSNYYFCIIHESFRKEYYRALDKSRIVEREFITFYTAMIRKSLETILTDISKT